MTYPTLKYGGGTQLSSVIPYYIRYRHIVVLKRTVSNDGVHIKYVR